MPPALHPFYLSSISCVAFRCLRVCFREQRQLSDSRRTFYLAGGRDQALGRPAALLLPLRRGPRSRGLSGAPAGCCRAHGAHGTARSGGVAAAASCAASGAAQDSTGAGAGAGVRAVLSPGATGACTSSSINCGGATAVVRRWRWSAQARLVFALCREIGAVAPAAAQAAKGNTGHDVTSEYAKENCTISNTC